jgi:uncharacterized membrane protein
MDPRRALTRVGIASGSGIVTYLALAPRVSGRTALLIAIDVGSFVLLGLAWLLFSRADADLTRARAGAEDPGRTLVYAIVVFGSFVSLLAVTVLVSGVGALAPALRYLPVALCLATAALSWTLTHTAFAFRYAHLYYREDEEGVGGVDFPGKQPPTYMDFAYLAFTVGMCFQVSDACVSSPQIRSTVLLHAVVSFAYNSIILAFVLSLVFSLANAHG